MGLGDVKRLPFPLRVPLDWFHDRYLGRVLMT